MIKLIKNANKIHREHFDRGGIFRYGVNVKSSMVRLYDDLRGIGGELE